MVRTHKQFCLPQGELCLYAGKQIADKRLVWSGRDITIVSRTEARKPRLFGMGKALLLHQLRR
jgi:hypothetical protein